MLSLEWFSRSLWLVSIPNQAVRAQGFPHPLNAVKMPNKTSAQGQQELAKPLLVLAPVKIYVTDFHFPLASPRSASESDSSSFEAAVSILELGKCDILCMHFKSQISVSYISLAFPNLVPTVFQRHMFCYRTTKDEDPNVLGSLVL